MRPRRPPAPLRWLRRALLVAMLVVVGAVAALFQLGRSTRPRPAPERPAAAAPAGAPSPRDAVVVTEGFEYEQRVEGKPVFRIRGARMTTDRGGRVELEEVGIELYRTAEPFVLRSRRATYDRATGEAQLEGDVELEGARQWQLFAERIDLVEGGKSVVSGHGKQRVHFRRADELSGNAGALRFTIDDERLELSGRVRANGRGEEERPEFELEAERLVWQGGSREIDAEREVELRWGESRLAADRVQAQLAATAATVERADAVGAVRGDLRAERGARFELAAERCAVEFEVGGRAPAQVELAGGGQPARLDWDSAAGRRTLEAPAIAVRFAGGSPASATAGQPFRLDEAAADGRRRELRGAALEASFDPAGALAAARATGGVVVSDGEIAAEGGEAQLTAGGERALLTGAPAQGRHPRGELFAPRLLYERTPGRLSAEGGVRARFEPEASPLAAGEAGTGREPVWIEAKQGSFSARSRGFLFEGRVQAVQGTSLLFAERLEGDEPSGTTTASGKVRTIWRDPPAPGAAPGTQPAETVATAESLLYRRGEGVLRYAGDVLVRQPPRELRASEVVVELSEARRAERLHAKGAVVMTDGATGESVRGDLADYGLAAKRAVVTGQVVAIQDRDGNLLRGRRALFDFATGAAQLLSGEP